MSSISLVGVSKRFGDLEAISNVSFNVDHGEFFCILGPSGAGKTTTLRTIAGLHEPDTGDVLIDGRSMSGIHPRYRRLGFFFQDVVLYPHLNAFDNIAFALRQERLNKPEIKRRVGEIVDVLHLGHLVHRKPATYSGGERQRVALARILVRRSGIYLLDEPLSNLDAKLRLEARAELRRLQREFGQTAVYVTPDQSEAMAMADRILVLDQGKVVQVGAPLEVYDKPASKFVSTFIGTPSMNMISCSIRRNGAHSLIVHPRFAVMIDSGNDFLQADSERPLLLGLRPSDIHVVQDESDVGNATLMAKVTDVEEFGHRALVELDVGGEELMRALVPGFSSLRIGENTKIRLDLARVHLIDPQTGRVVLHGSRLHSPTVLK